jgi:hypothetical protein
VLSKKREAVGQQCRSRLGGKLDRPNGESRPGIVRRLLERQIRLTNSGSVDSLTDAQWREYNKREVEISTLLRQLDEPYSPSVFPPSRA